MEEIIEKNSGIDYEQPVMAKADGSYIVTKDGLPYHVTENDPLYIEVSDWAAENPDRVLQETPPPPPTPEEERAQREKDFSAAINLRLDAFAELNGYDSMDKARLASLTDAYKADGDVANAAYAATWEAAIELWEDVASGTLAIADALAELPALVWPE